MKTPIELVETYGDFIDDDYQALIADSVGGIAWVSDDKNARHIVKAVNYHESLVNVLSDLLEASEHSSESHYCGTDGKPDPWDNARALLLGLEAKDEN